VTAGHDTDVTESLTARVTHQSDGGAAHDACSRHVNEICIYWDFTQHRMVIYYLRFWPAHRSHLNILRTGDADLRF
jgi:hypothetical protein